MKKEVLTNTFAEWKSHDPAIEMPARLHVRANGRVAVFYGDGSPHDVFRKLGDVAAAHQITAKSYDAMMRAIHGA